MSILYLIWLAELLAFAGIIWWKSKQPSMTKEEQEFELAVVSQRSESFLMNTTKQSPYNGVEN